jgi:hypothetical protein
MAALLRPQRVALPDLLDVELQPIVENEFLFRGIEASTNDAARAQHFNMHPHQTLQRLAK